VKSRSLFSAACGAVLLLAFAAPAASAGVLGGASKVCTRSDQDTDVWCDLGVQGFPGGTVHVDVDAGGSDLALRRWTLYANHAKVCSESYTSNDPARSWTCTGVPGGYLSLSASKAQWQDVEVGIRW
jgi:hypothetical protein